MRSCASYRSRVRNYLLESVEVKRRVSDECTDSILAPADLIAETFRSGGKVLLCGNGGSAADCANTQYIQEAHLAIEHILCELVESDMFRKGEPAKGKAL